MTHPFRCLAFTVFLLLLQIDLCAQPASNPAATTQAASAPAVEYERTRDIIYGRSYGTSLTMDKIKPKGESNGRGLILVVSGGWFSSPEVIQPAYLETFGAEFLRRGYTIFAVCHGSNPKFTIPEAIADLNRSVRFIRSRAAEYEIDPDNLGIFGGSAGGHLSLMIGCANQPANEKSADPVDKVSSKVQCVACFFPPTDFLNYGENGGIINLETGILTPFRAAFDFRRYDEKSRRMLPVTDGREIIETYRAISPAHHVDKNDPPVLIFHGDKDLLVPIQQATTIIEKLKQAGVEATLVTREGEAHGWKDLLPDLTAIADFFDKHLIGGASATAPADAEHAE